MFLCNLCVQIGIKYVFVFVYSFRLHFWLRQDLISQDYHIVNIVLHSVVCLLTYLVYNLFLGPEGQNNSFYATALFAVHPIHTEAVSTSSVSQFKYFKAISDLPQYFRYLEL